MSHITSSGRDHSCHHFWLSPITTSGHRSFVMSLQSHITSSSHHHSYCHFCTRYHIGTWVIGVALCHSSHIRTLFICAVASVAHYHIRTGIIRSVTSVTHHHTWTLIICAVLNPHYVSHCSFMLSLSPIATSGHCKHPETPSKYNPIPQNITQTQFMH